MWIQPQLQDAALGETTEPPVYEKYGLSEALSLEGTYKQTYDNCILAEFASFGVQGPLWIWAPRMIMVLLTFLAGRMPYLVLPRSWSIVQRAGALYRLKQALEDLIAIPSRRINVARNLNFQIGALPWSCLLRSRSSVAWVPFDLS